jgi:hypothetical protein
MLEFSVPKLSRVESQVSMTPGANSLGDLTVRDLQEMVLKRHDEDRTIEGEAVDAEFEDLV